MYYKKNIDYTGRMNISSTYFDEKPKGKEIAQIKFNEMTVSNDMLSSFISNGYCYCPTERKLNKVSTSDYICIDVDDSTVEMNVYVDTLTDKPTIYYTTPSNGNIEKSQKKYGDDKHIYRFRLLYALDTPTSNATEYEQAYRYITSTNNMSFVDFRPANQYYNGSKGCEIHCTDRIYSIPDYIYDIEDKNEECETQSPSCVSEETIRAFKKTRLHEFLLWFVEHNGEPGVLTETPYIPSDIDGMLLPAGDYYCIPKKYCYYDQIRGKKVYYKWKDGENRHGKLFLTGLVIKQLNPYLSPDELFYGFVKAFYLNFDIMNSDGSIKYTRERIIKEFNAIMATDLKNDGKPVKHRSFEVDSLYCIRKGITKRKAVCEINNYNRSEKKEEKYQKIDSILTTQMILSMTYKKCLSFLYDKGIEISMYSFKNYLRDRGIKKIKRKKK